MAVASGSESTTETPAPAVDRAQWWADVQAGVSALLTEAAHPVAHRLAG